jgi:hypothetical protein
MTELETLRVELRKINSYPLELESVDCGITGIGFFPGARGIWKNGDETLTNKSIMVLGHDFGAKRDYQNSVIRGEENLKALTWKNLKEAMDDYRIKPENCFFTNCIMGIRAEGLSAIGENPASKNENFETFKKDCQEFLIKQITIQKPQLIICLGLQILNFMSDMSTKLGHLSKIKSFKKLDIENLSAFENIEFNGISNYLTNLVFITHPTYRHLNIENRSYYGLSGIDAERKLVNAHYKN